MPEYIVHEQNKFADLDLGLPGLCHRFKHWPPPKDS